jgi:hypothetical protein
VKKQEETTEVFVCNCNVTGRPIFVDVGDVPPAYALEYIRRVNEFYKESQTKEATK